MTKTLSVAAIEHGTVIDHVVSGQAVRIIHLLGLMEKKCKVTIGLNLPSRRLGSKDLIKIEHYLLTNKEANEVTIFAPEATFNIIKHFDVVDKIMTSLPPSISGAFICPNSACITHVEPVQSVFLIDVDAKEIHLICQYCEKIFDRSEVKVKI